VLVEGRAGGQYEVEIVYLDGMRPVPFKVVRNGRTTRSIGRSFAGRREIENAACAAILDAA